MIDHTDQPRHGRALRPRGRPARPGAAALPVRQDQRAEVPQAPRRDRRDRPGHGQPDRPARAVGHRQALRGRPRLAGTTATASPPGVYNLRREVAAKYENAVRRRPRPRPRGRRHDRLEGGVQPHVPGPARAGRHGAGPGAELPDPRPRRRPGLGQRRSRSTSATRRPFLANVARVCESLFPRPKILILNYPHNPTGDRRRPSVLRGSRRAGEEVPLLRDPRLRLRRHLLRRLSGAELPVGRRGQGRRLRVHHDVQGLQHGRLAGRLRGRQPRDARRPEGDQGLLRLRPLPGRPDRRDRRPAARRARPAGPGRRVSAAPRRAGRRPEPARLGRRAPKAGHVRLGRRSPSPGGRRWARSTSP